MNAELYSKELQLVDRRSFSFLENKAIYLTGGTGLIGSFLVESILSKKDFPVHFILLVRNTVKAKERFSLFSEDKRLSFVEGTVEEVPANPIKADYYIHAASNTNPLQYSKFPVETISTNIDGMRNVLNMAKGNPGSKVLFLSSCEVYGNMPSSSIDEKDLGYLNLLNSRSCYNESKRMCENICASYKAEYNVNYVIARLARTYGPSMKLDDSKVLSQFLIKALSCQSIELKSNGSQVFDYLYVGDAVNGLLYLLRYGGNEAYNLTNNTNMSLFKIATFISSLAGVPLVRTIPNEIEKAGYSKSSTSILSPTKLKKLGFKSSVALTDGLTRTYNILKDENDI